MGRASVGGGKKWVRLHDLVKPSYSEMGSSISVATPSLSSYASPPASAAATRDAPVEVASGCSATYLSTQKECSRLTDSRCRPQCVAAGVVHNELLPQSYVTRIPQADQQILNFILTFLEASGLENVPVFINGGYVRDLLLGEEPDDLDLSICLRHCAEDVTVAGLLEKVTAFSESRMDLGITEVKVATVLSDESKKKNLDTFQACFSDKSGHKIEVDIMPTIGEETYEEGSRTPLRDTRGAPEQDALRRDLTVGAMLLQVERAHLAQGSQLSYRLLDFYGGVSDLRTGVLRAPYPVSPSAQEVADEVLRSPEERDLAAQLGLSRRTDKEALQKLWWAKILMDDPLRACRALVYCSKLSGFELHETFWDAMPFALQALHSKVAGSRKNTEYQKIGDYGFQACMEFYELAFTRTFGPGPAPSLRLASALFGGQDDNGVAKTLSEVTEFDLEAFRDIAEAMKPEEGCSGPEASELMGGLLAAGVSASVGLRGTAAEEFSRACDGMCVSNAMREAGYAPLHVASKWLADSLQPNALDVGFAAACSSTPESMRLYTQVWQDFQLPGTDKAPAWSNSKRRLAFALSKRFAVSECHKERLLGLKAAMQVVSCARPPVKGTVLSSPGLLEVPPQLRRQVLSLLEVSLRLLDHKARLETPQELQELFETFPLVQAALSPTVLAELTPRKPAKKAKENKKG